MPDLSKRSYEAELMDDLQAGGEDMERTLDELETVNRQLGGYTPVLCALAEILKAQAGRHPLHTLADIGCGGGDTLREIAHWAQEKHTRLALTGIDANPHVIAYARQMSRDYPEIEFRVEDVFSDAFRAETYDVITASLFCHHFTDEQLVKLFAQWKQQARLGVVINDLHRHAVAYHAIRYITSLFSRSPLIKHDAPLSVARGFRKKELERLLREAGIENYKIRWRWAFRWQVVF